MVKVTDFFKEVEEEEITRGAKPVKTSYPAPVRRYKLVWEIFNQSVEEAYFFIMGMLQENIGFQTIEKITDSFAASENSAFGGVSMQRLSIQQDKVGQFLATVGKMVKELFQLVRELRIIEERLDLYNATYEKNELAAEISLKGYWIDLVEQGSKNPASVYGMARELGFATLPDLFFSAPPMELDKVDGYVDGIEVNKKVKEVLRRKLRTYLTWKQYTYKELKDRFNFTVKFLRQHYDVIKLYMNWVKPYLRAIKKLSMDEKMLASAEMVTAFEGAMVEIEVLAHKPIGKYYNLCFLCSFLYRARPSMNYMQEGYQRGPIMVGRTTMVFRSYIWSRNEIYKFKRMKEQEDLELLGSYDSTLQEAMESLGGDLQRYLEKAGEKFGKEERKKEKKKAALEGTVIEPFVNMFKGAAQLFGAFGGPYSAKEGGEGTCSECGKEIKVTDIYCSNCGYFLQRKTSALLYEWEKEKRKGMKLLDVEFWLMYKAFKSGHKMLSW